MDLVEMLITYIIFFTSIPMISLLANLLYYDLKNVNIEKIIKIFVDFIDFMHENNPLLIQYYDLNEEEENHTTSLEPTLEENPVVIKYEEKYLERFKRFPNEFNFFDYDPKEEKEFYQRLKDVAEKELSNKKTDLQEKIYKIEDIIFCRHTDIDKFVSYFDLQEEYKENPENIDLDDLYQDLLYEKDEYMKKLFELEESALTEEELRSRANESIVNKHLDKYIDNYILENTPLGNIYMRYNNSKKSFEYFSNNSIPYRYLEPVGRKYVMTYWCKPIFVDIEEELKKAEERYEEEKKKKEEENKSIDNKNNTNKVLAQFKSYNKETKHSQTVNPMKNRNNQNSNFVLPVNLPDVNMKSDKQLLKENANRYTWEGRLTNFSPLKKIDRKKIDKKLEMTYSDFKKMKQKLKQ